MMAEGGAVPVMVRREWGMEKEREWTPGRGWSAVEREEVQFSQWRGTEKVAVYGVESWVMVVVVVVLLLPLLLIVPLLLLGAFWIGVLVVVVVGGGMDD